MRKNKFNLENIKTWIKHLFYGFFDKLKFHTDSFLMLIFLLAIAGWGFIFYTYAYKVSVTSPEVSVTVLKINTSRLNKVADDIKERAVARESIDLSGVKNPFEDEIIDQNITTSQNSGNGLKPGSLNQSF